MTVLSSNPTVEEIAAASVRCTDSRLFEVWRSEPYAAPGLPYKKQVVFYVQWDDSRRNGHNTMYCRAITMPEDVPVTSRNRWDDDMDGVPPSVLRSIPSEVQALTRWNGCSSDGPMHYLANTCYMAGDRDCHGLRKGERRQIVNGRTKEPCWHLAFVDERDGTVMENALPTYVDGHMPPVAPRAAYVPWERIGEGKARELDEARRVAIWPEATDEELTAPDLREKLIARLPGLLVQFRAELETYGIPW